MILLTVVGTPAPQGSKRAIPTKNRAGAFTGRVNLVESSKAVKPWREDVRAEALKHRGLRVSGAVAVDITFYLARPSGHYRTGRNAHLLRDAAPARPERKPDLDKLVRSTLDALTSADVYRDDAAVVDLTARKRYADDGIAPGAIIAIHPAKAAA